MDRIRHYADMTVRRSAGLGLLGIGLVILALSFHPRMALFALAALLTAEALALWAGAALAQGRTAEVWLMLDGRHGGRSEADMRRLIAQAMRETRLAYAKRLAGPAAAAWVFVLGKCLFG